MAQNNCILWCFICFLSSLVFRCQGQGQPDSTTQYFSQKPKLAKYSLTTIRDFGVAATSTALGDAEGEIRQNLRREAFLRFPVYMKNKWLIGLGLIYRHEKFRFEESGQLNYPFFERLEDKGLRRTGLDVLFQRTYPKKRYLKGGLSIRLNGDTYRSENLHRFLKVSLIATYSRQKSKRTQIGWGLAGGYDLGTPLVYPLFVYQHYFNSHLQVDLNLPKKVSLIYGFSDKMFLSWTNEISGASYHIDDPILNDYGNLELRKSEFRSKLTLEREIHDWLWFSVECGTLKYINFFLSEPNALRDQSIIELQPSVAYFFQFSVFMVPPKKIYEMMR